MNNFRNILPLVLLLYGCGPTEVGPEKDEPVGWDEPQTQVYNYNFNITNRITRDAGVPAHPNEAITLLSISEASPIGTPDHDTRQDFETRIGVNGSKSFFISDTTCRPKRVYLALNNFTGTSPWLGCEAITYCENHFHVQWASPYQERVTLVRMGFTCDSPEEL